MNESSKRHFEIIVTNFYSQLFVQSLRYYNTI